MGRTKLCIFHPQSVSGKGCCGSSGKREVWADLLHQPEQQGKGRGKKPNTQIKSCPFVPPKERQALAAPPHAVTPR